MSAVHSVLVSLLDTRIGESRPNRECRYISPVPGMAVI